MKPNRPPKSATAVPSHAGKHQLRIIGGQWRSRRLPIIDLPGLRPTPDRVRETLFNWLQMPIRGARCLDLFAGSGALGLEALSRGAAEVVFVEKHHEAAGVISRNLITLEVRNAHLFNRDALAYLNDVTQPFDVIFLDPPFHQNLLEPTLDLLRLQQLVHDDTYVYVEHERELVLNEAQWGLSVHRETFAGQVRCALLRRHAGLIAPLNIGSELGSGENA